MKVLVCGGRSYRDWEHMKRVLNRIHQESGIDLIVCGAQRHWDEDRDEFIGADWFAIEWAIANQVDFAGHPARWTAEGKSAGPRRNARMLTEHTDIDLVVAFPGGTGTAGMVANAKAKGIRVYEAEVER